MLGGIITLFGEKPPFKKDKTKKYILMIEDDGDLAEMYKMKLEKEGFAVLLSRNGKQGLKDIRDIRPDLVLLDILMDKKDGFDVLAEIQKCPLPHVKNVPIIVLTNLTSPSDQEEGKRLGARDWWVKAHNTPAEVASKVKKFLKKA
ncbi:response regulator [Patescibacteria group bacterium]|nr:response regulator [Patescibacteria group bacterium]MBU4056404.1 response regulator [Patescibacteria group bacterium]MBU4368716.1 response regulator [Patescibacteria group bacterium]